MLFTPYGTVLDVVALKTTKMRGQAHIVFKDIATAAVALRALDGTVFFGKEMVCKLLCEFDRWLMFVADIICKGQVGFYCQT
jgi:RNA recognition motif-containing protein